MFKNALVSVSDKTGLVDFLRPLVAKGLRVVSTGGTAQHLQDHGIPVVQVSEQTNFPEVMDGRVRTLHPHIHMALLARPWVNEDQVLLQQAEIAPFDLVICNLYPFEEALIKKQLTGRELVEYIDVGGPSMLRAAAKNYEALTVICDPADYGSITGPSVSLEQRQALAAKVFAHTAAYDAMIAGAMTMVESASLALGGQFVQKLRYGENPQQKASWYRRLGVKFGLHQAEVLQGKELSYNNLLDLDAAVRTVLDFTGDVAAIGVKHNNPCGIGLGSTGQEALSRALKADPISIFGGIVAVNTVVDEAMAQLLVEPFLECVVAPGFSDLALDILSKKKNLRLLNWPQMLEGVPLQEVKSITGGFLVQSPDQISCWTKEWELIGHEPNAQTRLALSLAWRACANLKSNAIAIANDHMTLGLGMGQVNRVDAVEQAITRFQQHHHHTTGEIALASDAFFPFPDSIERLAAAGIRWVVQPGGSVKDAEVMARARELGVNLVLTRIRHFRH